MENTNFNKLDMNLLGSSATNISLDQGKKYKKYQKKISKNLEKKDEKFVEGFEDMDVDGLTKKTEDIIKANDYSNKEQILDTLRQEYQKTLDEYQSMLKNLRGDVTGYISRVNSSNPYLNKNIRFTNGTIAYVTKQGIVKTYSNMTIYNNTIGKNGCPSSDYIQLSIPWSSSYTQGKTIPTNPPLVVGTPMKSGQSCGNEGTNVFVNELIDDPSITFIGAYNNNAPVTEVLFVPKMNSTNSLNGYNCYASSTYLNNNSLCGPWMAFNQNKNDFWHSQVSSTTGYNPSTGDYTGTRTATYTMPNGETSRTVKGEQLWVLLPGANTNNAINIPLIKYDIQGRQDCCGSQDANGRTPNSWMILGLKENSWYFVDEQTNQNLDKKLATYTIANPAPYQGYMFVTTNCGSQNDKTGNRYCVQISQWNLYTTTNYLNPNIQPSMTSVGKATFDQCGNIAVNTSNKYFSVNNVDNNGIGTCMLSNELSEAQQYGPGYIYSAVILWQTNTTGTGSSAILTSTGSLAILNNSGQSIYSTPVSDTYTDNYIGCYFDKSISTIHPMQSRAMQEYNNGSQEYNIEQCRQIAKQTNNAYFALQNSNTGTNAKCMLSNDLSTAKKYGIATNCSRLSDGLWSGGSRSNALYSADDSGGSYYVILQDDGNMCIYRGTGPTDNQGLIWATSTNGKQQQSQSSMAALNNQYGRNYMLSNEQLLPNQFLSSTSGNLILMMKTDGNLVLYTNNRSNGYKTVNDVNIGINDINALYKINEYGLPANMGKLAFIDENSNLYSYPVNNQSYSTTYSVINGIGATDADIQGATLSNTTVDACKTACNMNSSCAGFNMSQNGTACSLKTKDMYPFGGKSYATSTGDLYVRNRIPSSPPIGVSNTTNTIDSVRYQNYTSGGTIGSKYGMPNLTETQKQQLSQLQTKMDLLTKQINDYTGKFGTGAYNVEKQSSQNYEGIQDYLKNLNGTHTDIENTAKNTSENITNILKESDIVVLQKNYEYLFWSILATGAVLISMTIVKKQ